jgi:hypothetical protein
MAEADLRLLLRTVADTSGAETTNEALRRVQRQASQSSEGMNITARSALSAGAAFLGVQSAAQYAAQAVQQLVGFVADAPGVFAESQRVARATSAAYGSAAGSFTQFAQRLGAATGFSNTAILEAALSARTLSANYGLTTDQTQKLIQASADLATVRGIGVAEAFERVQSAIRGEAEASEFLGLTLNDTFIKNNALNGSVRNTFERMTDAEKAQIRYGELLRQTAQFSGLAASGASTLEGAQRQAARSSEELSKKLGSLLAPALKEVAIQQKAATDGLTTWLEQWQKMPTEQEVRERAAAIEKGLPIIGPLPAPPVPLGSDVGARAGESAAEALRRGLERVTPKPLEQFAASGASATERAASARAEERRIQTLREIALRDQAEAAVRDITSVQQHQLDLQRQAVDLAAQEAQIRLGMLPAMTEMAERQRQMTEQQIRARQAALPATEALEDLRFAQQRAQLIAANRSMSAEERSAARRDLRSIGRAMPGAELAALEAGRGVTLAERGATRLGMEAQLFEINSQRQLEQVTAQQTANGYLSQIAAQKSQAIELTINLGTEEFQTEVFKQLVEAEKQAQGPTVVKVSGVRR